jgi:hypothetical protein
MENIDKVYQLSFCCCIISLPYEITLSFVYLCANFAMVEAFWNIGISIVYFAIGCVVVSQRRATPLPSSALRTDKISNNESIYSSANGSLFQKAKSTINQ